mmetsp:Transcript_101408/g.232437  ORF Transcript_101408/g.232437 Transcript_101408/m.232437 type:complete len:346 (-) Transcript_101408:40-1077(-)
MLAEPPWPTLAHVAPLTQIHFIRILVRVDVREQQGLRARNTRLPVDLPQRHTLGGRVYDRRILVMVMVNLGDVLHEVRRQAGDVIPHPGLHHRGWRCRRPPLGQGKLLDVAKNVQARKQLMVNRHVGSCHAAPIHEQSHGLMRDQHPHPVTSTQVPSVKLTLVLQLPLVHHVLHLLQLHRIPLVPRETPPPHAATGLGMLRTVRGDADEYSLIRCGLPTGHDVKHEPSRVPTAEFMLGQPPIPDEESLRLGSHLDLDGLCALDAHTTVVPCLKHCDMHHRGGGCPLTILFLTPIVLLLEQHMHGQLIRNSLSLVRGMVSDTRGVSQGFVHLVAFASVGFQEQSGG